jgi:site-specific DNA-methyltransferase (adenine-specific)
MGFDYLSLSELWRHYNRISSGPVVLTAQSPFDKILGASNISLYKYEWIWNKSRATGHLNANRQPLKNHENVLVFYDRQCPYNPQGLSRKIIPTVRRGRDNGSNYGKSDKDAVQEFENYPRSVLNFPSEAKPVHPTQKPVQLMEYMINTYTNREMTVLDNCMGSGTTGVACVNTGRKFIGIEKDPVYFELAKKRIEEAQNSRLETDWLAELETD